MCHGGSLRPDPELHLTLPEPRGGAAPVPGSGAAETTPGVRKAGRRVTPGRCPHRLRRDRLPPPPAHAAAELPTAAGGGGGKAPGHQPTGGRADLVCGDRACHGPRGRVKRGHPPHVDGPGGRGAVGGSRLEAPRESTCARRQDRLIGRERQRGVRAGDPGRDGAAASWGRRFPLG